MLTILSHTHECLSFLLRASNPRRCPWRHRHSSRIQVTLYMYLTCPTGPCVFDDGERCPVWFSIFPYWALWLPYILPIFYFWNFVTTVLFLASPNLHRSLSCFPRPTHWSSPNQWPIEMKLGGYYERCGQTPNIKCYLRQLMRSKDTEVNVHKRYTLPIFLNYFTTAPPFNNISVYLYRHNIFHFPTCPGY